MTGVVKEARWENHPWYYTRIAEVTWERPTCQFCGKRPSDWPAHRELIRNGSDLLHILTQWEYWKEICDQRPWSRSLVLGGIEWRGSHLRGVVPSHTKPHKANSVSIFKHLPSRIKQPLGWNSYARIRLKKIGLSICRKLWPVSELPDSLKAYLGSDCGDPTDFCYVW